MKYSFLLFICCFSISIFSQKTVSITIDDVPNTSKFLEDNFQSKLLNRIDSLDIPVAIFINEGLIYKTDAVAQNFSLLNDWVKHKNVILGNHTFNHSRYSAVGIDSFQIDIQKGAFITNELARKYDKSLRHFRFPYNDLGIDSLQNQLVSDFLKQNNYIISPSTIESSDWMFNFLYEYYLEKNQPQEAKRIARIYLEKTMEYFEFFETMALLQYGREVHQIYLCHDNSLNADYLPQLIKLLQQKNYQIIDYDKSLEDKIYHQEDFYKKKWGVSWFYRWMKNHKERIKLMRQEPTMKEIIEEYESLLNDER